MKTTQEKLQDIRENGYQLDFGNVFEQTFENYKKIALIGGAVFLVFAILMVVVAAGVGAIFGMATFMTGGLTGIQNIQGITTVSLIIKIVTAVFTAAFIAPLNAGMLKIAHKAENYSEYSFSTAFDYYKSRYFKTLFVATLVISLFTQAFQLGFEMLQVYNGIGSYIFLLAFLNYVVMIVVSLLTLYTTPLIVFGDLTAGEAIKASIQLVLKKFWVLLILGLVVVICACLGLIGICIGIFFTAPIMYSFQYIAYRNALSIDETSEMDEIGTDTDYRF